MDTYFFASVVYTIVGPLVVASNVVLLIAILGDKKIRARKELVIVTGLALSDLVFGVGTFLAGRYRYGVATGEVNRKSAVASGDCYSWQTGVILLIASGLCSSTFMLAMTCERIYAIFFYAEYRKLTKEKMVKIAVGLYVLVGALMLLGTLDAYLTNESGQTTALMCVGGYATYLPAFKNGYIGLVSFLSVAGYGLVLWGFKRQQKKVGASSGKQLSVQDKREMSQERRMTQTVGVVTLFSLLFYCLPYSCVTILTLTKTMVKQAPLFWMFVRVNNLANVYIIYWRQKDVRQSIDRILCFWRTDAQQQQTTLFVSTTTTAAQRV